MCYTTKLKVNRKISARIYWSMEEAPHFKNIYAA